MTEKKVSVIVPAYNSEKYIERCVSSILKQTYTNLQVILINDGSTDNTLELLKKFSDIDPRVEVFSNKNQGVAASRNYGLSKVKGSYLIFVDSDDYIDKKLVETMVKSIDIKSTDLVLCNSLLVDIDQNIKYSDQRNYRKRFFSSGIWNEKIFWTHLYNGFWGECTVPWGKLYKSSLFDGLKYLDGKTNEDDYILYDVIHRCRSISVVEDKLYYHMDREGSITNSNGGKGEQFLDGVDAIISRTKKAMINGQGYLVNYSLKSIPNLMVMQFQFRKTNRYKELKKVYKSLIVEADNYGHISYKNRVRFIIFYYLEGLYNFIYKVHRKLC